MRVMQDFKIKVKEQVNTLQFSLDVINVENLLNSDWGLSKSFVTTSPLTVTGRDAATGKMRVAMRKIGTNYISETYQDPTSVASTWAIQIGIRYLFN